MKRIIAVILLCVISAVATAQDDFTTGPIKRVILLRNERPDIIERILVEHIDGTKNQYATWRYGLVDIFGDAVDTPATIERKLVEKSPAEKETLYKYILHLSPDKRELQQ